MIIEKLPAVREKFFSESHSLPALKAGDPRITIPLSLEYKKKQAKALLKLLRKGEDWSRLQAHHPAATSLTTDNVKLADAQLIIAHESGFSSWPRLKHHIEAVKVATDAIKQGQPTALDGDKRTLHIRCGNDIRIAMAIAGFAGDFLTFADPYVLGAVPQTQTLDEFIRIRADVISNNFEQQSQAYEDLSNDYKNLEKAREYERVNFWFEHDAYDVLAFLKLLHFFSNPSNRPAEIQFICITSYPGVKRFNGIGHLPTEAMRVLWEQFEEVIEAQFEFGRQAWEAFTAPDPQSFQRLAFTPNDVLPVVIPAMRRQLQELPWLSDGLSLTERLTLQILADKGGMNAAELFFKWYTVHYEPLVFMGDSIYWKVLDALAIAKYPAITFEKHSEKVIEWQVGLTDFGKALLQGQAHWVQSNGYDRWFGGTYNTHQQGCWYWDESEKDIKKD